MISKYYIHLLIMQPFSGYRWLNKSNTCVLHTLNYEMEFKRLNNLPQMDIWPVAIWPMSCSEKVKKQNKNKTATTTKQEKKERKKEIKEKKSYITFDTHFFHRVSEMLLSFFYRLLSRGRSEGKWTLKEVRTITAFLVRNVNMRFEIIS